MADPERPLNVVLVLTDQQRYDSLGCTGNAFALTPHLDALAGSPDTCVFDRHMTAAPVCMPSRASLVTGCYPSAHGVWTNGIALPRAEHATLQPYVARYAQQINPPGPTAPTALPSHHPTLADLFAAAGRRTISVGKLHLTPTQSHPGYGFAECHDRWVDGSMAHWHGPYYGFEHVDLSLHHGTGVWGHYKHWLEQHHPDVAAQVYGGRHTPDKPTTLGDLWPSPVPVEAHPTTWCADRANAHIHAMADADRPFFLWVGIPDPHHPFTPPAELATRFAKHGHQPVAADPAAINAYPPTLDGLRRSSEDKFIADPNAIPLVRRYTDAMNHLIDTAVGSMIDTLKTRGLWERTVFIFTSDHGDYLGDYGLIRKSDNAQRVLNHTPLLLHAPGTELPARSDAPVSNTDLLPTLCDLCGIDTPAHVHGESILRTHEHGRRRPVMIQASGRKAGHTNVSVVDESCRYTWYTETDHAELFDHRDDPMELRDLAGHDADRTAAYRATTAEALAHFTAPRIGRISTW